MTICYFHAIPLTPIYIGDGTTLSPEDFLIDGNRLLRFSPTRVIADMRPAERARFLAALDAGRLQEAQAELHRGVKSEHHLEHVAVGPGSANQLSDAVDNPLRRCEASQFVRSGGRPYLPGSSLKGALRTAIVNDFAHDLGHVRAVNTALQQRLERLSAHEKATGEVSDLLQRTALDLPRGTTEADPLRWLTVADAMAPEAATRFDQVSVGWKDGKAPKMQLHVERLWSYADGAGERVAASLVTLSVTDLGRQSASRRLDPDRTPKLDLRLESILDAAHAFHERRWRDEMDRFFKAQSDKLQALRRRLESELRRAAGADARMVLLRVGRFGHFESKSVDDWRLGWQALPQPGRHVKQGATRAVLMDIVDYPLPFGWLMLCPDTPAVRAWVEERRPTRLLGAAFLDGEPVEILGEDKDQVLIRTRDGDTDWLPSSEIEYR